MKMTYEETAKELNKLAKQLYETEFIKDSSLKNQYIFLKYRMFRTGENLMQYIDNAYSFTLVGRIKKDSDGNITGHYYESIIYRSTSYKKVYEIRFRLN